uniref:Ig-like domain-containing protein n=1 Tax=Denticeps clupeoides TaxID=299321 RepID=A0AAY4AJ73_9TELE
MVYVDVGQNLTLDTNQKSAINVGYWIYGNTVISLWYPGSVHITPSFAPRGGMNNTSYQLSISSVQLNDAGVYILQGIKPVYYAQYTVFVEVPVSNLTLVMSNTNPIEFTSSVILTCTASGSSLTFVWMNSSSNATVNGLVQTKMNSSTVTIQNVTRHDVGPFYCIVSNHISNQNISSIKLNIRYGPSNPSITVNPERTVFKSGSVISLSCFADSNPPASYKWIHNGVVNATTEIFRLSDPNPRDSGNYTCLAYNSVTLLQASATRAVTIMDPISTVTVNAGTPIDMMNFTLGCNVSGTTDYIQWMMNGAPLNASIRIVFNDNNRTITFSPVELYDNGVYQCEASNAVSNMISPAYMLMVYYGPRSLNITSPAIIKAGVSETLICTTFSWPQSHFTWFFNNSIVAYGAEFQTGPLTTSQSGNYTCVAHNNMTNFSETKSTVITVIDPISNISVREVVTPMLNMSFTLSCDVTGTVDHIQWTMNGTYIHPDSRMTFDSSNRTVVFSSAELSDNGAYVCEASNAVSSMVSQTHTLNVNYGPWSAYIVGPSISELGSNVTFHCSSTSQPACMYTWHFNNSIVATGQTLEMNHLPLSRSGLYTCEAYNNVTKMNTTAFSQLMVIGKLHIFYSMKLIL